MTDRTQTRQQKKSAREKFEADYLADAEANLIAAKKALADHNAERVLARAVRKRSKAKLRELEDDVTFYGSELVMLERNACNAARRRARIVIDRHSIDRLGPLYYHNPGL